MKNIEFAKLWYILILGEKKTNGENNIKLKLVVGFFCFFFV